MALIDKASLLMVPSTYEDGTLYNVLPSGNKAPDETGNHNGYDQTRADFTFSRGSNLAATRVNADGLIEKGRENLLLQSNSFDTTWAKTAVTLTSGQSGYDGSSDAWEASGGGNARVNQSVSNSGVQTFSIYAKAGTSDFIMLNLVGASAYKKWFNLSNGTLGGDAGSAPIHASIDQVGTTDWYRCSIVANDAMTLARFYVTDSDGIVGATGSIYIQDAQLEAGLVATDYIETGSTTATAGILEDMPRINYDANGENGALLLEPSRSNLVPYSEYGGGYTSIDSNITKTDNATTSPEGVDNAVKLEGITGSGGNQVVNIGGFVGTSVVNRTFTGSVYIKPVDSGDVGQDITLSLQRNGGDFEGLNSVIEIDSADWKRYDLTYTFTGAGAADQTGCVFKILRQSSTIDDVYLYGAQLEEGSYPTSYIPTHGAAVTRGADDAEADNISDLIGQTEGTFLIDAEVIAHNGDWIGIYPSSGSAYQNGFLVGYFSGAIRAQLYAGGTAYVYTQSTTNEKRYKIAITYTSSSYKVFIDGVKVHDVSKSTSFAVSLDRLAITGTNLTGKKGNVKHKEILMFPTALTDAECVTLTTL